MVQHADIDHTGLPGVGGGSAVTGRAMFAVPAAVSVTTTGDNLAPTAGAAYILPIVVPAPMLVRAFVAHMQAAASGTYEWGLFDPTVDATACVKLAGGTGTLNGTGQREIAATGAPVTVAAGGYFLIFEAPASNVGSMYRILQGAASHFMKSQAAYAWDDTPNVTTGWNDNASILSVYLLGDVVSGTQW